MNKDRLVGAIMIGLVLIIIGMYFLNSTNDKKVENENEELKALLNEEREKNERETTSSTEETEGNNEEEERNETEDPSNETIESSEIDSNNAGELISSELNSYDAFIEDFINTLNIYDDQEMKNEKLTSMTGEKAQTYLKENYYILEDGEQVENNEDHGTHAEGDFEPLEMDMELASMESYYTYVDNKIEVIALYRLNTTAGEEKFSGNYVLNGTLTKEDGEMKFETIDSIVAINDPNASELFQMNSDEE